MYIACLVQHRNYSSDLDCVLYVQKVLNECRQFRVSVGHRPVVQEALYAVLGMYVFDIGLLSIVVVCYSGFRRVVAIRVRALVDVFYCRSGEGCRFNGNRSSNTEWPWNIT